MSCYSLILISDLAEGYSTWKYLNVHVTKNNGNIFEISYDLKQLDQLNSAIYAKLKTILL